MSSPADECKAYHAKIEQSISNLLKINAELEYEKRLLQDEINELRQQPLQPSLTYEQQYLIDLCSQMAETWRPRFYGLSDGIQEIIRAVDKVNGRKEGDAIANNPRDASSEE